MVFFCVNKLPEFPRKTLEVGNLFQSLPERNCEGERGGLRSNKKTDKDFLS